MEILTVSRAADLLRVDEEQLMNWVYNCDDFPAHLCWGRWYILTSELSDFIKKYDKEGKDIVTGNEVRVSDNKWEIKIGKSQSR